MNEWKCQIVEHEKAYKLGGPSSNKNIKDEEWVPDKWSSIHTEQVAMNDYINSQLNSLTSETPFYRNHGLIIKLFQMGLWHVQTKQKRICPTLFKVTLYLHKGCGC